MYEIRKITSSELEEALSLAWEVFLEFEAPDYKPEGTQAFRLDIVERQGIDPAFSYIVFG